MEIVIAHLTRMQPGFICAAGIDTATGKHVRPCLPNHNRLSRDLFQQRVFDIASVVDLGSPKYVGEAPELEDHCFNQAQARFVRRENGEEFWNLLFESAATSLGSIFGPDLTVDSPRATVKANHGTASLGCLMPLRKPRLCVETMCGKPTLRLRMREDGQFLNLSVTDLRLYQPDQSSLRMPQIADVARRIACGVPLILGVGLTRLFRKDDNSEPKHYLQVNNIHLEDNPIWTNG